MWNFLLRIVRALWLLAALQLPLWAQTSTTATAAKTKNPASNLALRYAAANATLFVSTAGSDSNDGASWGSAKATLAGAISGLSGCSPFGTTYTHCGAVYLGAGSFPAITSTLKVNGPIQVIGLKDEETVIKCNVNAPCINVIMSPFSAVHGPEFENLRIENLNAGRSAVGIQAGGLVEPTFRNLHFHGWSGAGQVAWLWANPGNTWSERVIIDHVHLDGSATGLKIIDRNTAPDYMYWRVANLEINIPNRGVGIDLENDSVVTGGTWTGTINTNVTAGGGSVFLINGTSQFGGGSAGGNLLANDLYITVDNSGLTSPMYLWNVTAGATVMFSGQVIGANGTAYSSKIAGTFLPVLNNNFSGSSTPNQTDMVIQAHTSSGNPANLYILRFQNPASNRILSVTDPGGAAGFVFTSPAQNSTVYAASFKSEAVPSAGSGIIQLASGDAACWRNNADSADLCISKNSSDQFLFHGQLVGLLGQNGVSSGQITLASGSGSHSFGTAYASSPNCSAVDLTDGSHTFTLSWTVSDISVASGTGADVISWICAPTAN